MSIDEPLTMMLSPDTRLRVAASGEYFKVGGEFLFQDLWHNAGWGQGLYDTYEEAEAALMALALGGIQGLNKSWIFE